MANKRRKAARGSFGCIHDGVTVNAISRLGSLTETMCSRKFAFRKRFSYWRREFSPIWESSPHRIWDICDPNLSFRVGEENASKRAAPMNGVLVYWKRFSDYVSFGRTRIKTRRSMVQRIKLDDLRTYFDLDAIGYSAASAPLRGALPFRPNVFLYGQAAA